MSYIEGDDLRALTHEELVHIIQEFVGVDGKAVVGQMLDQSTYRVCESCTRISMKLDGCNS